MKLSAKIILVFSVAFLQPVDMEAQQDEMVRGKKEHKKVWRRWRKNREAYNPYVDAKAKNKPSARMAKGNRKDLKRQKRAARKQLKYNKKKLNN